MNKNSTEGRPTLESENLELRKAEATIAGIIDERQRRLSVAGHHAWREATFPAASHHDDIDELLDDEIQIDPYVTGTNNRRSDRELAKMLDLIDNLPISENGKEGDH